MQRLHRLAIIAGVAILLWVTSVPSHATEPDVVTLGGDEDRNHQYQSPLSNGLCVESSLPRGWTLAQALVVRYPKADWEREYAVFHLGQTHLSVFSLSGDLIASHRVQDQYSWGTMSYVKRPPPLLPNPEDTVINDILYVTTGDARAPAGRRPGVKAFRVSDLLNASSPAVPLGQTDFAGRGIVSAPLYMGEDTSGRDRIVIAIVPDKVVIVKNLANNGGRSDRVRKVYLDVIGWDSGTATKIGNHAFAITAGEVRLPDGTFRDSGVHLLHVMGFDEKQVWRNDFDLHEFGVGFDSEGLSHIARDKHNHWVLYAGEQNGSIHRIHFGTNAVKPSSTPGFTNTGPSSDDTHVYYGLRWEGSTSSAHTASSTNHGRLVAVRKSDWRVAWSRPLLSEEGAPAWGRSWINVSPIVWEDKHQPDRRVILVGDAGGSVSAWSHQGAPEQLFLNKGAAPAPCSEIESTDPSYRPEFTRSNRARLTANPHQTYGADAWHNTQGVATEMSVYGGRLFTGYNNAVNDQANSSLVIFRNATNLSMAELTAEVLGENGQATPATPQTLLRAGQRVRVKVPLRLEGDPLAAPREVPVAVGWTAAGPEVRKVTLTPFQTRQESFDLMVPNATGELRLLAVANPALYDARRDHEQARGQIPPEVQGGGPDAVPAAWKTAPAWQAAVSEPGATGEVWVLDNARSWGAQNPCDLTVHIDQPGSGAAVQQEGFDVTVTVRRTGCGQVSTVSVTLTGPSSGRRVATFADAAATEATVTFPVRPTACGQLNLQAVVDPDDRVREQDEANNRAEQTVAVQGCDLPPAPSDCSPDVSPEQCKRSKPHT